MVERESTDDRRRRWSLALLAATLVLLVAFVVVVSADGGDGQEPAARPSTTEPTTTGRGGNGDIGTIPVGVELMADGRVRFHLPPCAADGVTAAFWHVVLRDPSADLEAWRVQAERPQRVDSVIPGVPPEGFRTTERLDADPSDMRQDTGSVFGVFRREPLPSLGVHFRLSDLVEGRIAYRPDHRGPLRTVSSPTELAAAIDCS